MHPSRKKTTLGLMLLSLPFLVAGRRPETSGGGCSSDTTRGRSLSFRVGAQSSTHPLTDELTHSIPGSSILADFRTPSPGRTRVVEATLDSSSEAYLFSRDLGVRAPKVGIPLGIPCDNDPHIGGAPNIGYNVITKEVLYTAQDIAEKCFRSPDVPLCSNQSCGCDANSQNCLCQLTRPQVCIPGLTPTTYTHFYDTPQAPAWARVQYQLPDNGPTQSIDVRKPDGTSWDEPVNSARNYDIGACSLRIPYTVINKLFSTTLLQVTRKKFPKQIPLGAPLPLITVAPNTIRSEVATGPLMYGNGLLQQDRLAVGM